jgi:hypothetical protein
MIILEKRGNDWLLVLGPVGKIMTTGELQQLATILHEQGISPI